MIGPAPVLRLEDVEGELRSGFKLLRFTPLLERQFDRDTSDERCRHIILHNYIALAIYHAFLFSDYRAMPDAFGVDLVMHFGVMTPIVLGLNWLLSRRPPVWIREGAETLGTIVLAITIGIVVAASLMPDRDLVLATLMLVVLFATMMQRIRFWYVIAGCAVIQVIYGIGLTTIETTTTDRMIASNAVAIGIILFSLVASYNLEREGRRNYLLALCERFRHRDLEIASLRDALTGIGNRRALDLALSRLAHGRLDPARRPAVLLLDIDHFKTFNDTNGHQSGDACLKRVADVVAGSVREGDGTVYRFGGEEFLILLDATTLADALVLAERIRLNVARAQLARDANETSFVTVSIGVATGHAGSPAEANALISAADRALYAAKRNGRNQVSPFAIDRRDRSTLDSRLVA